MYEKKTNVNYSLLRNTYQLSAEHYSLGDPALLDQREINALKEKHIQAYM